MRHRPFHAWLFSPLLLFVVRADDLQISTLSEDEITAPIGDQGSSSELDPPPGADNPTELDSLGPSANTDFTLGHSSVTKAALQPPDAQQASLLQLGVGSVANSSVGQRMQTAGGMASAVGYIRSRLASEESFTLRLRRLLAQSSKDSDAKQNSLHALELQVQAASRKQTQMLDTTAKKIAEEEREIDRQHSRADAAEKKLRSATSSRIVLQRSVKWLRERARTLFSHLTNVTHIGKAMESQLAAVRAHSARVGQQLQVEQRRASLERGVPRKIEAQLRKVQADEASEKVRVKASERKGFFLQQRYHAMNKQDQLLQTQNKLLRTRLRAEADGEARLRQELNRVRGTLREAQQTNAQLRAQYADSLQGVGPP